MLEILKQTKSADVVVIQYPRGDALYYHPQLQIMGEAAVRRIFFDLVTATANIQLRKRLRSADTNRYEPFTTRLKFGERCFSHAGPKAWNALPAGLNGPQCVQTPVEDISV